MMKKCYNKTQNKALRDGNLKGLLINNSLSGVIMTASNNTRNIKRGQSHVFKLTCGIGYNSKRAHKSFVGGKYTEAYAKWHSMFMRCYNKKIQSRQPQYIGCSVSSEWHDFQDFADWYYKNKYSGLGYQLDKDLLIPENKVYSPDTCCLIPQELNKLLTDHGSNRGVYPQGVNLHKPSGKYRSQIRIRGRKVFLGCYLCPREAHQAYVVAKEAYVKEIANEWRGQIEESVYDALMKWKLNN